MSETHGHVAEQRSVLLDVGDGRGAVVVYVSAALLGEEMHIAPLHVDTKGSHVAVHARLLPDGRTIAAAVFPSLPCGTYRLEHAATVLAQDVDVYEGTVTELYLSR